MLQLNRMLYALMVLSILMPLMNVDAATYYVATNGSDSSNGTSVTTPWSTIAKAAATMVAGDTTYVRGGVYNSGHIRFSRSGTATAPIRLLNYPGERPHIRFNSTGKFLREDSVNQIVFLAAAGPPNPIGWITVEGFEISNGWGPIKIEGGHNMVFRNNHIHSNMGGFGGHGRDIVIDRNIIRNWGRKASCATYPPGQIDPYWGYNTCNQDHALYLVGHRWTITNNLIFDGLSYGVHIAGVPYNPTVHPTTEFAEAKNWVIAHNTIAYQMYGAAIISWQPGSQDHRIENNIFYENGQKRLSEHTNGFACQSSGGGHTLRNNLFYATAGATVTFQANCAGLYSASDNLTTQNPLFVNGPSTLPVSPDFHLQAKSPAIDKGLKIQEVTTDFTGATRTAPYDIGAYEVAPGSADTTPPAPPQNVAVR